MGALVGVITFAAGSVILARRNEWILRRPPTAAILIGGVIVIAIGFGLQQVYLRDRYLDTPPLAPLYAWAQHVENTRMAITGQFSNDTYPLDGRDGSNYVQVIGSTQPGGGFSPIVSCTGFRRAVNAGRYRDVITITAGDLGDVHATGSQETRWTSLDLEAKLIRRWTIPSDLFNEMVLSVFRIDGQLDPASCPPR
jgi:hypothetical protein